MTKISCFSSLIGRRKKIKAGSPIFEKDYTLKASKINGIYSDSPNAVVPLGNRDQGKDEYVVENAGQNRPVNAEHDDEAYEGSDEHDESPSLGRDFSDSDLQAQANDRGTIAVPLSTESRSCDCGDHETPHQFEKRNDEMGLELIESGHVSDPGIERYEFWASPVLKRSCSTLETRNVLRKASSQVSLKRSHSFGNLQITTNSMPKEVSDGVHESPVSVTTPGSADKVMLKKHSSSQVLPSRSRKLWWKLFLWSHRNMHNSRKEKSTLASRNHTDRGGYCSDTLEQRSVGESSMLESPEAFLEGGKVINKKGWDNFHGELSGSLPQHHWFAFSTESSSLTRVDEWVNSVHEQNHLNSVNEDETSGEGIFFPPSPKIRESLARSPNRQANLNVSEDVLHANNIIQSLNSTSTVAHISGMGLKVVPNISRFSSLRSINLSGNYLVHINPGALPKGLHTLNLSRNKIVAIEGLRDLTRLRMLDLSYNKISRIGQGLSNCTLIKELYLAGNKISMIEGLHRLLKLTVLDMSFNKISTEKSLGQLVANYNSLQALNLLGNPIQGTIGDDQLRKVVVGLLPKVAYLNKQLIKHQRSREVASDSVARAALGNGGRRSHRKVQKQIGSGGTYTSGSHKSTVGGRKSNHVSNKSRSSLVRRK